MSLPGFDALYAHADGRETPIPVAAAGGADATVIQALELARRRGWVAPILTGETKKIRDIADSLDIDLTPFQIVEDEADSAVAAVKEVRAGRAACLMKGQISTPRLMKAVLDREVGLRTGKTICQVVLMEIRRDQRSFLMTDTGVTVAPTPQQKEELVEHVISVANSLDVASPRVAMMAASEKAMEAIPNTLEAQDIAEKAATGAFGNCLVQGPLSFDLAYARDAGEKKKIDGEVTGQADAMVFPDLTSANLTVKGIMYTADCRFGGILCGTMCPVIFMSRADTVETRLNSLAYALRVQQLWK